MNLPPIPSVSDSHPEYSRPNNAWRCGKAEPCDQGPNKKGICPHSQSPCVPKRSLVSKRRFIKLWLVGFVIACLSLFLSLDNRLDYLSPGPLHRAHAEVAECKDCHQGAKQSMGDWIIKAVTLSNDHDDKLCLDCHELGETPFSPHSVEPQLLSGKSASAQSTQTDAQSPDFSENWKLAIANSWYQQNHNKEDELSCSACHREHQGRFHPIDDFNEQQCHSCHQKIFDNVEHGHPEFSQYPYKRVTRIRFDHGSHMEKHFSEADFVNLAPESCSDCHQNDASGQWMLSESFEQSCSGCHLNDILGNNRATDKGLAVLAIPEIDTQSLAQAGYSIGQWPQADSALPPMMKWLLGGDEAVDKLLANKNLELYDLTEASPEQLAATAQLAWEIKTLFYDIAMGGTEVIHQRLSERLGDEITVEMSHQLIASLPRDTLINNQEAWFPNLAQEIADYRQGTITLYTPPTNIPSPEIAKTVIAPTVSEEISLGDDEISLSDDEISLSDDEIKLDDDEISLDDEAITLSDDEISLDDNEITLSDDDIELDDDKTESQASKAPVEIVEKTNEDWSIAGGWYREGSSIRYRPAAHNDRFFKTWLDLSLKHKGATADDIFALLSTDQPVGNCLKCHSIEDANTAVNWKSFQPDTDIAMTLTRFSHSSHYNVATEGCGGCHSLNTESNDEDQPSTLPTDFHPIEKQTCTQCHQQGRAPIQCLTCHQYHGKPHKASIEMINDSIDDMLEPERN